MPSYTVDLTLESMEETLITISQLRSTSSEIFRICCKKSLSQSKKGKLLAGVNEARPSRHPTEIIIAVLTLYVASLVSAALKSYEGGHHYACVADHAHRPFLQVFTQVLRGKFGCTVG